MSLDESLYSSLFQPMNQLSNEQKIVAKAMIQFAPHETKDGKVYGNTPWDLQAVVGEEHVYETILLGYTTRFGFAGKLEYECLVQGWLVNAFVVQCKTKVQEVFGYKIPATFIRFRIQKLEPSGD